MEIWLIQHGERTGPFSPYDVEGRIQRNELEADQPAWHEGMDAWSTLGEMPYFETAFERLKEQEDRQPQEKPATPPPLPFQPKPLLIRRFFARWFDLHLMNLFWWGGLALAGRDLAPMYGNPWMLIVPFIPWLFIEVALLHRFGTTPGKALLGLSVRNLDGSLLSPRQGLLRTMRVWALGLGLTLPLLVIVCQGISAWLTRRFGASIWDLAPGHRVVGRRVSIARIVLFGLIFLFIAQALGVILLPAFIEIYGDDLPWLRDLMEKSQR